MKCALLILLLMPFLVLSSHASDWIAYRVNNADHTFSLVDNPNPDKPLFVNDIAKRYQALLVINGGFYTPEYLPTGYLKIDGNIVYGRKPKGLSGYIGISKSGRLKVFFRQSPPSDYPSILQTGPFLVDPGGVHGIKTPDTRVADRIVVVGHTSGDYTFLLAKRATLYDLASRILSTFDDVDFALNLDGGPVAGFWIQENVAFQHRNFTPSRNYLAVFPRD